MNVAHRIFTNTVGQIALRAIDVTLGVITLGLITRYLGQELFGNYTTVNAFLQFFVIIIDFGLYLTLLREVSATPRSETERITNNIVTLRLVTSASLLALACAVVFMLPYSASIKWGVVSLSLGMLAGTMTSTITALFQRHLRMVRIAFATVVGRVVLLGLVLAVIANGAGIQPLFWSTSLSFLLIFLICAVMLRRLPTPVRLRLQFDPRYIRTVLAKTWPLAVTTALNLLYLKTDTIILSLYQSQESVGLYGASYRVVDIITTFPHMFMGLVMPLMTAAWAAGHTERLRLIWSKTFSFFSFLALPMIAGTLMLGEPLMRLVAGSEFAASGSILKVLIIASAAIFFATLYTYAALVAEQQRRMIKFFAFVAVVALTGYFVFIPTFSYWGAAWTTVASELLIAVSAWLVTRRAITLPIPWATTGKLLTATLIMTLFLWLLMGRVPLIPLIIAGTVIYGAAVLWLKAITISDIRHLMLPADNEDGAHRSHTTQ